MGLLGEDVELLDGVIVKKMPKSALHEGIVRRLQRRLQAAAPAGYFVTKEGPLTCTASEPEPDLALVHGDPEDLSAHPTTARLVIEVAVSTEELDRRKAMIYAQAGVQEYWLVEPERRRATVFRDPVADSYARSAVFDCNQVVASAVVPGFNVSLSELFSN